MSDLEAINKRYADRHFTCNGCGFSWNCDSVGVDEHGHKIPAVGCYACLATRLRTDAQSLAECVRDLIAMSRGETVRTLRQETMLELAGKY